MCQCLLCVDWEQSLYFSNVSVSYAVISTVGFGFFSFFCGGAMLLSPFKFGPCLVRLLYNTTHTANARHTAPACRAGHTAPACYAGHAASAFECSRLRLLLLCQRRTLLARAIVDRSDDCADRNGDGDANGDGGGGSRETTATAVAVVT